MYFHYLPLSDYIELRPYPEGQHDTVSVMNDNDDEMMVCVFSEDKITENATPVSLNATGSWTGGVASENRLYFIDNQTDTPVAYDFDGNRQAIESERLSP